MYSQNAEEEIIGDFLAINGVNGGAFLDIGAFDGRKFSNTLRLAELGWFGVCVEPSPFMFQKLLQTHGGNDKIQLVNAAVSAGESGLQEWFECGEAATSTMFSRHRDRCVRKYGVDYSHEFFVSLLPIEAIFEAFGFDFSVISIDVEGGNFGLFKALPWEKLENLRIICVEHEIYSGEMIKLASAAGFAILGLNAENLLLAR